MVKNEIVLHDPYSSARCHPQPPKLTKTSKVHLQQPQNECKIQSAKQTEISIKASRISNFRTCQPQPDMAPLLP